MIWAIIDGWLWDAQMRLLDLFPSQPQVVTDALDFGSGAIKTIHDSMGFLNFFFPIDVIFSAIALYILLAVTLGAIRATVKIVRG